MLLESFGTCHCYARKKNYWYILVLDKHLNYK